MYKHGPSTDLGDILSPFLCSRCKAEWTRILILSGDRQNMQQSFRGRESLREEWLVILSQEATKLDFTTARVRLRTAKAGPVKTLLVT